MATGNVTHNLRDWQQASRGGGVDSSYAQPRAFHRGITGQVIAMDGDAFERVA